MESKLNCLIEENGLIDLSLGLDLNEICSFGSKRVMEIMEVNSYSEKERFHLFTKGKPIPYWFLLSSQRTI